MRSFKWPGSLIALLLAISVGFGQGWTFLGPAPITNGQTGPPGTVTGAIRTILVHPTSNNTYYVGSVNGGVWKTTDGGTSWSPLTDYQGSTSIGAVAFDRLNSDTLIAGIGRTSSYYGDGGPRKGLMYSTNGGTSWTNLTNFSGGPNFTGVYARGLTGPGTGTIVAASYEADVFTYANSGLFRSTNGGNSWTNLFGAAGTGLPANVIPYNVYSNPTNDSQLFTAARYSFGNESAFLWRSTDAGATWTRVSPTAMEQQIINTSGNGNVIVSAVGDNAIVGIVGNNGRPSGLWRSTDGGSNWTQFAGTLPDTNPGGQGGNAYQHFNLMLDPTDATGNRIYLTGDATQSSPYNGRVFRLDWASGTTTNLFTNGTNAPHADGRALAIRPDTGLLLQGSDGGLATLTNPGGAFGNWNFSANGNLGISEVHDVAFDPVSSRAFGGTQDNGMVRQTATGTTWTNVFGGDGSKVSVVRNPSNPAQSIRYMSYQYFGSNPAGFFRSIYDSSGNPVSTTNPTMIVAGSGGQNMYQYETANGNGIQFYGPTATNRGDGERLYLGTRRVYESTDRGNNLTMLKDFGNGFAVSVIKADGFEGSTPKPLVLYVAANAQLWHRPDTGGNLVQKTAYSQGVITDLAVQSRDWRHIVISDDNQVFRSSTSGDAIQDITGNLLTSNSGVQRIYAVETLHTGPDGPTGLDLYLAGGRDGVYISRSDALMTWSRLGVGLPNALVTDLDYEPETDTLIVASLGRGIWIIDDFSTYYPIPEPTSLLIVLTPVLGVAAYLRRRRSRIAPTST